MISISNWFCTNSKNLFIHPGGHVELHDRPILASDLLTRNTKCCGAHPTVFHHPTFRKLQLKHYHVRAAIDDDDDKESSIVCWLFRSAKNGAKEKRLSSLGSKAKGSSNKCSSEETIWDCAVKVGNGGSSSPERISLVSMDNWMSDLENIAED